MSKFTDSIEHYCEGLHVAVGPSACCQECRDAYDIPDSADNDTAQEQMTDEGGFSWSQCDSCGSQFGGDRYDAHGMDENWPNNGGHLYHLSICADCLFFHANGDEPEDWYRTPGEARDAERREQDIDTARAIIENAREDLGHDAVGLSRGGFSAVDLLADKRPIWTLDYCREVAGALGED